MIRIKSILITTKDGHVYDWSGGTTPEYAKFLQELELSTHSCAQPSTPIGVGTINIRNISSVQITMETE